MLNEIVKIIAPHICLGCGQSGTLLCVSCSAGVHEDAEVCYRCNRLSRDNRVCKSCRASSSLYSLSYVGLYQGLLAELVKSTKLKQAREGCCVAARLLLSRLPITEATVTYVPTASSRVRSRGFDHSRVIAKLLAGQAPLPFACLLLRRGQVRQLGAGRKTRKQQMEGQFICVAKPSSLPKTVILIDDVVSTGATLEEAARTLREHGVKRVYALVLARNR